MIPEEKTAVIVLANSDDVDTDAIAAAALRLFGPELASPPAAAKVSQAPGEWGLYVGKYRSAWDDNEILVLDGALELIFPLQDDLKATMLRLVPIGKDRFRTEGPLEELNGETVIFEPDSSGRTRRYRIGGTWFERRNEH